MVIDLAIRDIEGSTITLASRESMMGNVSPERTRTLNAAQFDPGAPDAALAGMGMARVATGAGQAFQKIEDTTCTVGDLELECALYEVVSGLQPSASGTRRAFLPFS